MGKRIESDIVDLMGLIPERYQANLQAILLTNWPEISAKAYEAFLRGGRGLFFMEVEGYKVTQALYLNQKHLLRNWNRYMEGTDQDLQDKINRIMKAYDPREEVALFIEFAIPGKQADVNTPRDSAAMRVMWSSLSVFSQPENPDIDILPKTQRYEIASPQKHYKLLKQFRDKQAQTTTKSEKLVEMTK